MSQNEIADKIKANTLRRAGIRTGGRSSAYGAPKPKSSKQILEEQQNGTYVPYRRPVRPVSQTTQAPTPKTESKNKPVPPSEQVKGVFLAILFILFILIILLVIGYILYLIYGK